MNLTRALLIARVQDQAWRSLGSSLVSNPQATQIAAILTVRMVNKLLVRYDARGGYPGSHRPAMRRIGLKVGEDLQFGREWRAESDLAKGVLMRWLKNRRRR